MPKINLKHLSVTDLVRLRDEIETALSGKIAMERDELQAKIDALGKFRRDRSTPGQLGSRGAARCRFGQLTTPPANRAHQTRTG